MRKLTKAFALLTAGLLTAGLTGCFDDKESKAEQYREWRELNEKYVLDAEARKDENGDPYYTMITPSWAPGAFALIHWHNDRSLTEKNLSPMDNSTIRMTYELFDIDGEKISDSFANTDSVYQSQPNKNIIGVWTALTHMNVGDSVTLVLPSQAGYGEVSFSDIKPYSTLIYNIKLKAVTAYEVP